jgi:hypothetical protein
MFVLVMDSPSISKSMAAQRSSRREPLTEKLPDWLLICLKDEQLYAIKLSIPISNVFELIGGSTIAARAYE